MRLKYYAENPKYQAEGLSVVRILTGIFMIYHGWELFDAVKMNEYQNWEMFKNSPVGGLLAYAGKTAELLAGVLLTLGFWTRLAALILAGTMLYIAFFVGKGRIWYEDQHPFLFVLLSVIFFIFGGGRWSLDGLLSKEK